jgi:hypothetical protein
MGDQIKEYTKKLVDIANKNLISIGYQKLTVDQTAGGLALTVPTNATYAVCIVESAVATAPHIRYLECGPANYTLSTTDGIGRSHLDAFDVQGAENLRNFRVIRTAAGTTTLHIQYYK